MVLATEAFLADELERCSKCGTCLSVCPSYKHFLDETASPRGRIELCAGIQGPADTRTKAADSAICRCLGCLRCVRSCPSSVRVDACVQAAAWRVYGSGLQGIFRRAVMRGVVPRRRMFRYLLRAAAAGQALVGLRSSENSVLRHLPMLGSRTKIPVLARRDAASIVGHARIRGKRDSPTVAVFSGCLSNFVFPNVVIDALDSMRTLGLGVVVPENQVCCGVPAWIAGDRESARRLARANVSVFERTGADKVVTLCASCGRMLKETYPELLGDESGTRFAARVEDAASLLWPMRAATARSSTVLGASRGAKWLEDEPATNVCRDREGAVEIAARKGGIAYHRPCHSAWYDSKEISRSVEAVVGCEVHMLPDGCCGCAGTFAMRFPESGRAIAQPIVEAVRARAIGTLLTPCPGCMMHLDGVLREAGLAVKVQHPVSFLARY